MGSVCVEGVDGCCANVSQSLAESLLQRQRLSIIDLLRHHPLPVLRLSPFATRFNAASWSENATWAWPGPDARSVVVDEVNVTSMKDALGENEGLPSSQGRGKDRGSSRDLSGPLLPSSCHAPCIESDFTVSSSTTCQRRTAASI